MIERINQIMRDKNITPRQFASELGIPPSSLSHIMNGRNKPSLDFIMKIMQRWPDININWLMFGTDDMLVDPATPSAPVAVAQQESEPDLFSQSLFDIPEPPALTPIQAPDPEPAMDPDPIPEPQQVQPAPVPEPPQPQPDPVPEPPQPQADPAPMTPQVAQQPLVEAPKPQLDENRLYESAPASVPVQATPGEKRLVKVILLYSDHTCEEFVPGE
ncbi:MAG: helix-turn-helix domain-containing protein [Bacteroidales bacterium]|nr:helix-turn-helix domain-containing protein [Bacteroidales bacterium]